MNTPAASTHDAIVQPFYLAFHGCPAGPAGLALWSQQAAAAGGMQYWIDVVDQGRASLADVSLAIPQGAQGSDLALATLRLEAATLFTALVEAIGGDYPAKGCQRLDSADALRRPKNRRSRGGGNPGFLALSIRWQTWVPACAGTTVTANLLCACYAYSDSAANALSRTCSTGPTPEILRYFGAPGRPDSAHLP